LGKALHGLPLERPCLDPDGTEKTKGGEKNHGSSPENGKRRSAREKSVPGPFGLTFEIVRDLAAVSNDEPRDLALGSAPVIRRYGIDGA
jgi:hypothetical protein